MNKADKINNTNKEDKLYNLFYNSDNQLELKFFNFPDANYKFIFDPKKKVVEITGLKTKKVFINLNNEQLSTLKKYKLKIEKDIINAYRAIEENREKIYLIPRNEKCYEIITETIMNKNKLSTKYRAGLEYAICKKYYETFKIKKTYEEIAEEIVNKFRIKKAKILTLNELFELF